MSTTKLEWTDLDKRAVDTVRVLAMDAVQKVGNGHPGTAMSLAPAAYLLFQRYLSHDPTDPDWTGRDRFVLSCGHSSLTLYIQLYLSGYGLELDDLQALRTWGSLTPGHPEHGHTAGVETTTGPLGQGVGNAVGMAMAARRERGLLDPDAPEGESLFDHHVYCIASDGDIEEGISGEASLAGRHPAAGQPHPDLRRQPHLHRGRHEHRAVRGRRRALRGLRLARPGGRLAVGGRQLQRGRGRPGAGAGQGARGHRPAVLHLAAHDHRLAGTERAEHRQGPRHVRWAPTRSPPPRRSWGSNPDKTFDVDGEVLAHARQVVDRGRAAHAEWDERFAAWAAENADGKALLDRLRTRDAARRLDLGAARVPGRRRRAWRPARPPARCWRRSPRCCPSSGAARPTSPSPTTRLPRASRRSCRRTASRRCSPAGPYGRVLHFGIREHAMGSIMNGIALHGGTRVYGGTFLVFSDYMRPAVRLAALMQLPVTYVWTHDSIGLGEDGPTHQPVEHLAALRAIPGLDVVRPADANETVVAWRTILEHTDRPAGLCLSRQDLPMWDRTENALGRGHRPRRLRPRGRHRRPAAGDPDRHRVRGAAGDGGPRDPRGRGHADPGRVDAVRGVVPRAGPRLPAAGAARRVQGPGQRRGRRSRWAGATSSARPARS